MNTVLIAEDEPVSRRFLHDALEALGFVCVVAEDGLQAQARATVQRFDLLLLDLDLPGLHGLQVLQSLRTDPAAASQRSAALALTAEPDPALPHRLLAQGFTAVGRKPLSLAQLRDLIATALPRSGDHGNAVAAWDDAAALRASGNDRGIVEALRVLMRRDLPQQRMRIVAALARGEHDLARSELHRLRAACGFCGAVALSRAVEWLSDALDAGGPHAMAADRFVAAALAVEAVESSPPAPGN